MTNMLMENAINKVIDMMIEKSSEEVEEILQSSCKQKLLEKLLMLLLIRDMLVRNIKRLNICRYKKV